MPTMEDLQILVVDDEDIIREGAERILCREGWKVKTAGNGEQGLAMLDEDRFHILLLDLMMPGISGMEVLKAARETRPDLLVVVITGYATIESAVEAMKHGAYDFVPKPFTPDQLRIVIRRAIDRLSLEREAEALRRDQERSLQDIANEKSKTLTIINHMADGVLVTDREGAVVLHNPAVLRMLGLSGEPEGRSILEWTRCSPLAEMLEELLDQGCPGDQGISRELAWGDPPEKFFSAHATPVCNDQGDILGSVTIFSDVTWFKEMDRAKSDFVDIVSHELRSPLSSIRQQLSVVAEGLAGEIGEEPKKILGRVQSRIDGHLGMIRNLLDLSRIEAGQLMQQKERICLAEIAKESAELLRPEAESKNLRLEMTLDANAPAIHADRHNMETVLNNLVGNAIKYNRDGGTVSIGVQGGDGIIELSVSDTGVGVSRENLTRIFDKFFRIRTAETRKVIGSGIGLPLVKSIVDAHGGTITVESSPEAGTVFTVSLPAGSGPVEEAGA